MDGTGVPIGKQRHIRKGVAMHSIEETGFHARTQPTTNPLPAGVEPATEVSAPLSDVDVQRIRHVELVQRHRDLDDTVAKLSEVALCDELLIARLKKRKLQIKDSIARLETILTQCTNLPDLSLRR